MAKVYNFEQIVKNKLNKTIKKEHEIDFEILVSIIKFIYIHMENRPNDIFENITPVSMTQELFKGDRNRFAAAFVDMIEYWNLGPLPEEEIPMDEEFERYPTVEDLCMFVDEKINKKMR